MESIIRSFKTKCICTTVFRSRAYKTIADVEYATAGWVDSYNHRRLKSSLGMVPPVEYEHAHYAALISEVSPTRERRRSLQVQSTPQQPPRALEPFWSGLDTYGMQRRKHPRPAAYDWAAINSRWRYVT